MKSTFGYIFQGGGGGGGGKGGGNFSFVAVKRTLNFPKPGTT